MVLDRQEYDSHPALADHADQFVIAQDTWVSKVRLATHRHRRLLTCDRVNLVTHGCRIGQLLQTRDTGLALTQMGFGTREVLILPFADRERTQIIAAGMPGHVKSSIESACRFRRRSTRLLAVITDALVIRNRRATSSAERSSKTCCWNAAMVCSAKSGATFLSNRPTRKELCSRSHCDANSLSSRSNCTTDHSS